MLMKICSVPSGSGLSVESSFLDPEDLWIEFSYDIFFKCSFSFSLNLLRIALSFFLILSSKICLRMPNSSCTSIRRGRTLPPLLQPSSSQGTQHAPCRALKPSPHLRDLLDLNEVQPLSFLAPCGNSLLIRLLFLPAYQLLLSVLF